MSIECLTIVALILNACALVAVVYQVRLNVKSLNLSIKTTQIRMMPNANWILRILTNLESWAADLHIVVEGIQNSLRNKDVECLRALSRKGLDSPKGLVDKYCIKDMPPWLSMIWLSGARYYYDAKVKQASVWNQQSGAPNYEILPEFIDIYKHAVCDLNNLIKWIDDVVPEFYLNTPASISDERYYD